MRTVVSLGVLALAALPFAPVAAAAPQPAVVAASGSNDAACTYDSLSASDRKSLQAQTFDRMTRGADQEAAAPSRRGIDAVLTGARAGCAQHYGWTTGLSGLAHEYASLSLARDAFRRLLSEQGVSADVVDAWHRAHRSEFGRELSPAQQAAFTAELDATHWAAADPSDSAIDVAVGYLAILNHLERCQKSFATTLAYSQARPVQTAAR